MPLLLRCLIIGFKTKIPEIKLLEKIMTYAQNPLNGLSDGLTGGMIESSASNIVIPVYFTSLTTLCHPFQGIINISSLKQIWSEIMLRHFVQAYYTV